MKNVLKVYLFVLFAIVSVAANATALTEKTVKDLIDKVDNAVNTLNASEVAATLSNDVEIIMNVKMQGKDHVMKPTKQQYMAMLQQGWSAYENYKYSKSNVNIQIQGGKALVTSNVKESMTVQGKEMKGETKEEVTIELVNGKPLITKMVGYTSM